MTAPGPISRIPSVSLCLLFISAALTFSLLAVPVSALPEQTNFEAYLGDTIDLHGVSYTAGRLYLLMTGPGLPANGVTLTDTSLQADKGFFTTVDVAGDQTWSMKWNTDRIRNQIKPGTYTVYVSTSATDVSGLSGGYKTLTVYLKDPGPRNDVSISAGTYVLHPEDHTYTNVPLDRNYHHCNTCAGQYHNPNTRTNRSPQHLQPRRRRADSPCLWFLLLSQQELSS